MIKHKNTSKILLLILLVVIILSFWFTVLNLNHKCISNNDCPICIVINRIKDSLKFFFLNSIGTAAIDLSIFCFIILYLDNNIFNKKRQTLVSLKVKLIN